MPRNGVEQAQQAAEADALGDRQVAAPGVDVLAEQRELADAVGGQRLGLGDERVEPGATARGRARTGTMQYEQVELQPIEICSQAW